MPLLDRLLPEGRLRRLIDHNRAYLDGVRRRRARAGMGPTVHPDELPDQVLAEAAPLFVLSTGRAGTKLLTELMADDIALDVRHTPAPELVLPSRIAYAEGAADAAGFRRATFVARYEVVQESWLAGATYVETNNRITFFAPWLAELFPRARFLHLVRHPADFVRSGVRRGYYTGRLGDEGRIRPRPDDPAAAEWSTMSPVARVAWLWNATQAFCEDFKATLTPERQRTVRAEDLFTDPTATESIFAFINRPAPPRAAIAARIAVPVNAQRTGDFPTFDDWSAEDRAALMRWAPLAGRYGYAVWG